MYLFSLRATIFNKIIVNAIVIVIGNWRIHPHAKYINLVKY